MRTRLALAVVLVTLVAFGGSALAARTNEPAENVRWISEETEFVIVLADGTRPDPETLEGQLPQPGDEFFFTNDVFATEDGVTKGQKIGTDAIHCVFGAANHLHCDGMVFLDEGQISLAAAFPVNFEEEEEFEIDVAFTGGTGKFRDVGGDAHLTDISPENHEVSRTLWEVRLLHLANGTGSLDLGAVAD